MAALNSNCPAQAHRESFSSSLPTCFAPPERKSSLELAQDLQRTATNELVSGLMTVANGLLAVLNDKRQVVALNGAFLKLLGIDDVGAVLGLRPGECVNCIHAREMPGGCGTSSHCATCGAVVAIMAALVTHQPQERTCAMTVERDGQKSDLYFSVRSCPLVIDAGLYVLLFMQDISVQQHRACLDRAFFHDINNILCALIGKSEVLARQPCPPTDKLRELHHIVLRIAQEVAIQNALQKSLAASYMPLFSEISIHELLVEVRQIFHDHPLAAKRRLEVTAPPGDRLVSSDFHLVSRILINMVTNALEATGEGGTVTLAVDTHGQAVVFSVWNAEAIPEQIACRVFERNFSTKGDMGRGLGTYAMKIFGEKVLGGTVQFTSSPADGTTFNFSLPAA